MKASHVSIAALLVLVAGLFASLLVRTTGPAASIATPPDDSTGELPLDLRTPLPKTGQDDRQRGIPPDPVIGNGSALRATIIAVMDREREPVQGARVLIRDQGAQISVLLGETPPDGEPEVAATRIAAKVLHVRHPLFAPAELLVPRKVPEGIEVELRPGLAICGRVVRVDGGPLPEGVRVVACQEERLPRITRGPERLERNLYLWPCELDPTGQFCVSGLDGTRRHLLTAGAPGWIAEKPVPADPVGTEPEIVLRPIFGSSLTILEEGGGPLRTSDSIERMPGISSTFLDPDPRILSCSSLELSLAGVDPAQATDVARRGNYSSLHLFTTDGEDRPPRPLALRIDILGYETSAVAVPLPRVVREVPDFVVRLRPSVEDWGELQVRIDGTPPIPVRTTTMEHVLKLELEDHAGQLAVARLMRATTGDVETLTLPFGSYAVRVSGRGFSHPPDGGRLQLYIGAQPAELLVPWPETVGALEIELQGATGTKECGRASVFYKRADERSYRVANFRSSPYVFPTLPPGEYRVLASAGLFRPPAECHFSGHVVVKPGEATRTTLVRMDEIDPPF